MSNVLPDGEIAEGINSFNSNQSEVLTVFHACAKDYVKYGHDVEPGYIFLSGRSGTGKSHSIKLIYHAISKTSFIVVRILKNQELFYLDLQEM